ncbi:MAG: DUF2267 domain-containing protein [Elusimicrobia bacterium]|nr:DUF2267 domain-containing protein [Elusimicrobiota bacterium]
MRRHTPDAFDTAVQKGNMWLKDIEQAGKLRSRFQAYAVLRSVLHALRDCLPPAEAVKFSAQMPLLVKGVFFDGWKVSPKPERLSLEEFHAYVRRGLKEQAGVDPATALKAVLATLSRHISPSVLDTLQLVLPREVHAAVRASLLEVFAEERAVKMGATNDWQAAELGGPFGE